MNCCPSGFSYGAPVCVALSTGEPVQYKTKINSDQSITYVDSAGVESSSLPVGSSVINCNQISWVANQPASDGQELPIGVDCDNAPAMKTFDACVKSAVEAGTAAVVAAINGRPDYTAQLTSIGDTLTAMKSDTAAINTGVASSLVLLQAIVDKPNPTAVDLQPVLDKLDELIALDTTENSTLVDVKNQLIAANVTLSNAETLLTHIDADMHEVVTKLQSALDLLNYLQALLTTIDGRIAAIQTAITTADANNVSALNDIRTELQAINVNTDTLEALITAGNVLLTAIVNNTDGVEGLLTEIRDRPVTDSWLLLYDGSIGGCKPFIRRIVDNVVTDTKLDLTTPYTVTGTAQASCPDAPESVIVLSLVDYVAEHTVGGGRVKKTPAWAKGNGWRFVSLSGTPITSWDYGPWGYTRGTDANTSFKVVTQISVESGKSYNINNSLNRTQKAFRYIIDGVEYPIDSYYETKTWVATTTGSVEVGVVVGTNATSGGFNNWSVDGIDGGTVVPATCTNFVRTIKDGVVTDTDLDGKPYIVKGEVRTSCPDEQTGCTCTDELQALQTSVDSIAALFAPLEQPTHTPVSVTSGSYTLAAGVKSYSITFVDKGAISGAYRPAGYSTNADYVEQGYATALTVTGTSFIIEEVR